MNRFATASHSRLAVIAAVAVGAIAAGTGAVVLASHHSSQGRASSVRGGVLAATTSAPVAIVAPVDTPPPTPDATPVPVATPPPPTPAAIQAAPAPAAVVAPRIAPVPRPAVPAARTVDVTVWSAGDNPIHVRVGTALTLLVTSPSNWTVSDDTPRVLAPRGSSSSGGFRAYFSAVRAGGATVQLVTSDGSQARNVEVVVDPG